MNYNMAITAARLRPHWGVAVIDGYEGMEGNGPSDGTAVPSRIALASTDFFAADRVGLETMGIPRVRGGLPAIRVAARTGPIRPGEDRRGGSQAGSGEANLPLARPGGRSSCSGCANSPRRSAVRIAVGRVIPGIGYLVLPWHGGLPIHENPISPRPDALSRGAARRRPVQPLSRAGRALSQPRQDHRHPRHGDPEHRRKLPDPHRHR